ncbi:hypothetical protein PG985_000770 [Apiospora marii]|uniref:Uncharacterized protein n=1 Tax=Apiospora marii TaxID=335849 RepID=A0ABR1R3Q7_9PEZI
MNSKFPCWDSLSSEYRHWHDDVSEKNGASLSFQAWMVKQRTVANELFYDLKRLAVIKKWSRERFFRNLKELMDRKGYYFGSFEASSYETIMKGVAIKDTVYPWSVFSQSDRAVAAEETEKAIRLSQQSTTTCTACHEDGSTPGWGTPLSFTWDGTQATEKYYTCPKPGCTTAWNEFVRLSFLTHREGGGDIIQCPQCLSDICADCGAIKPTAAQKYWRQITAALDTTAVEKPTGSTPFRKSAHRKGFKERCLTDVYAPLSADDFFFTAAPHHHKTQEEMKAEADAGLISIPGTTMMFRADQSSEEIDEALEKERDMKQLYELRANTCGTHASTDSCNSCIKDEPRGRQIARIDFAPMHDCNPTDRWFSLRNRELYEESSRFCARWFGDVDFPADYRGSAWLEDYGEQFVQYSNLCAAEDRLVAGWETMMKTGKHRKWLVMGVLSQIMEKKIHSELLFGASEAENAELEKQDSMFLASDGYPRTKLRSQMINMFLGADTVSSHFWSKVDHLTNSTMAILLPLTNLLCYFRPPERWTDTFEMYSQLHSLIAQVGYFAVCMARDSTIFHVLSATPGARMDWGMEAQATYELYRECKDEAEARDKAWTDRRKAVLKSARAHAAAHAKTSPEAEKHLAELERQFRTDRHHRLRGARVKYAVWPMVTRYRPENEGVTLPGGGSVASRQYDSRVSDADLEQAEGQRILDIGKCVVIYYQGLMYPRQTPAVDSHGQPQPQVPLERDGATLFEHRAAVREAADEVQWARFRRPQFAVALAACSVLVAYRVQIYQAARQHLPSSLAELGALAREHWTALAWALAVAGAAALFVRRSRHVLFALAGGVAGLLLVMETYAWGIAGASWAVSGGSWVATNFAVMLAYIQSLVGFNL